MRRSYFLDVESYSHMLVIWQKTHFTRLFSMQSNFWRDLHSRNDFLTGQLTKKILGLLILPKELWTPS